MSLRLLGCAVLCAAFFAGAAEATTYDYTGSPYTSFLALNAPTFDASMSGDHLTGYVTFNFDTSATTGTFAINSFANPGPIIDLGLNELAGPCVAINVIFCGHAPQALGFITLTSGIVADWSIFIVTGRTDVALNTSLADGDEYFSPLGIARGPAGTWTVDIVPTPVPATLPLLVTGIGLLGLLSWRRKAKRTAP